MIGAIVFSSAARKNAEQHVKTAFNTQLQFARVNEQNVSEKKLHQLQVCFFTNKDEGQSNSKGQDVASQWLIVLAVAFGENSDTRVDVVLTQSLPENSFTVCRRLNCEMCQSSGCFLPERLWERSLRRPELRTA